MRSAALCCAGFMSRNQSDRDPWAGKSTIGALLVLFVLGLIYWASTGYPH